MLTLSSSDHMEFDRFYLDAFGDAGDFMEDISACLSDDDSFTTNESYSSSSSTSGDEQFKKKPKVQRNANKPLAENVDITAVKDWEVQQAFVNMPRLLKTDVRRSYSAIFQNVVNILDFPLMFEFLKQYCVPSVMHTQGGQVTIKAEPNSSQSTSAVIKPSIADSRCCAGQKLLEISGLQPVAQFWYNKMIILPDVVYKLIDTKIHTYSNTLTSKVVSKFNLSATRLVDVPMNVMISTMEQQKTQLLDSSSMKGKKRTMSAPSVDISMISDHVKRFVASAPLLETPDHLDADMQVTFHLDENKRIEKMEYQLIQCV